MKEYLNKAMRLVTRPSNFFKSVAREKNYWPILRFFVVLYILAALIQLIIGLPAALNLNLVVISIIGVVMGTLLAFVFPFVFSFLSHMGVWILGGRKGYFNTFKAATYGGVIFLIYGIISAMISTLLTLGGLINFNIINFIVLLAGALHVFVVQSIGVRLFHSISKVRAFLGVILVPVILLILWMWIFISLIGGMIGQV